MENSILNKSLEVGALGVLHIKSLHFRKMQELKKKKLNNPLLDQLDGFVLDGLDIPISQSTEYLLSKQPEFAEFEEWILLRHGGDICSKKIDMINDAVLDFVKNGQQKYPLQIQIDDPIFTSKDINFWKKNGYIVLKNAIDENECKDLENAIWEYLELLPNDPQNWKNSKDIFWLKAFKNPLLSKNKNSKKIHRAFSQLWGTDKLINATDRISFNPPLDEKHKYYGPCELHWDISLANPISFNLFGMIYLNDIKKEQGAFQCIPGFHKDLDKWLSDLDEGIDPREEILKEEYQSKVLKISANAGDLIICNHALPHSSSINRGEYPRFVQYIDMYPANKQINQIWI